MDGITEDAPFISAIEPGDGGLGLIRLFGFCFKREEEEMINVTGEDKSRLFKSCF